MIPEKDLALNFLRKQGWDAEIKDGVLMVYDADYRIIKAQLEEIGYNASFGVSRREHGEECI